jgi:hypothetical protein
MSVKYAHSVLRAAYQIMDDGLRSLSIFMCLTLFENVSFVHKDLTASSSGGCAAVSGGDEGADDCDEEAAGVLGITNGE